MRLMLTFLAIAALAACQSERHDEVPDIPSPPPVADADADADEDSDEDAAGDADLDDGASPDRDGPPGNARGAITAASLPTASGPAPSAAALATARPATAAPSNRRVLRLERAFIVDPSGFERPLAVSTLFLPAGWRWQGGVFWGQQFMCTNGYNFMWSAQSPDGSTSIAVLPQAGWGTSNYGAGSAAPGCPTAPWSDVRTYLQVAAQGWKRGARILDFRRRGDIERELASYNMRTPSALGEMRRYVEAGEILFAFQENGRDMRGSIAAAVLFSTSVADAGYGRMASLSAFAFPAWATTAPNGSFDPAFFDAIRRSMQPNPEWTARISGHNARIGQVALQEAQKRAAAIAQSNAEISRIREEAWNASQQSADRRARQFSEALRGVQSYSDADAPGGRVELSHNYNHAWRMQDGTYILTNDPNFEPWRDLNLEGRRLELAR